MLKLQLEKTVTTAVTPSTNVLRVAAMFGLGVDASREVSLVPATELTLDAHEVVFLTGPSGSGKSTLLRLIAEALEEHEGVTVVDFGSLPPLADVALVDAFSPMDLDATLRVLSLAGLNDAFVMLRTASQLSDGQRYRLRLAQAISQAAASDHLTVVLADEFGAALDRVTAHVIARNIRKWTRRENVCFVAATTHDDLLEPLEPDCVIEQALGCGISVARRETPQREPPNGSCPRKGALGRARLC